MDMQLFLEFRIRMRRDEVGQSAGARLISDASFVYNCAVLLSWAMYHVMRVSMAVLVMVLALWGNHRFQDSSRKRVARPDIH